MKIKIPSLKKAHATLIFLFCLNTGLFAQSVNEDDDLYSDQFGLFGLDGPVEVIISYEDQVVIGGDFIFFNGGRHVQLNRVGKWNGTTFENLGEGFNGTVTSLTVFNGDLIAAGRFTLSGSSELNHIARWDGEVWQALGEGFDNEVLTVMQYRDQLIAGGNFTASGSQSLSRIAAWNGNTWTDMNGGVQFNSGAGTVWDLLEFEGYLIAGGEFSQAGTIEANSIARWDGNNWQAMGNGFIRPDSDTNLVSALTIFDGELILSGLFTDFTSVFGPFVSDVLKWNGSNWEQFGTTVDGIMIRSMGEYEGQLAIGGTQLQTADRDLRLAIWNGFEWSSLVPDITGEISEFQEIFSIYSEPGKFLFGGNFSNFESGIFNFAILENNQLSPMIDTSRSFAPFGKVNSIISYNGDVIVGGEFEFAGNNKVNNITRFDGMAWNPMGDGFAGQINSLIEFNGELIAAGDFSNESPIGNVARWDGSKWQSFDGGIVADIRVLAVYDGKLLAAGANFPDQRNIMVWDGLKWDPLTPEGVPGSIFSLIEFEGNLILGGFFSQGNFSDNSSAIAIWDGENFLPFGSLKNGFVEDLIIFNGELVAAGGFQSSNSEPLKRIARWDNEKWVQFGEGFDFSVNDLEIHNGELFAGGSFTLSGQSETLRISMWNETQWLPVGSGTDGPVRALGSAGDLLHIAGDFNFAGNKPAAGYTTWGQLATTVTEITQGIPSVFELHQNFPNPFNPSTVIRFNLEQQGLVRLDVYNSIGQHVRRLVDGPMNAGAHNVTFNASGLSSGVYYYRLQMDSFAQTRKLTLIK